MKKEEEIIKILLHHFSNVYCDTCGADEDKCDYCHRKSMMWELDKLAAQRIAREILDERCE